VIQELLRTPPPAFVAARNEVVRRLKAEGDRDGAATVGRLRRIGVDDWALDVAAHRDPGAAADFASAAGAMLDAQEAAMAGRGGGDLRGALRAVREATSVLVGVARQAAVAGGFNGTGSSEIELATRVAELAANRRAVALLQHGLLGAEDPGVVDPFAIDVDAAAPSSPIAPVLPVSPVAAERTTPALPSLEPPPAPPIDLAAERARRRARTDWQRKAKEAEALLSVAERAVAKAEAVAVRTARRRTELAEHLATATAAAEDAEGALAAAEAERVAAQRRVDSARDEVHASDS